MKSTLSASAGCAQRRQSEPAKRVLRDDRDDSLPPIGSDQAHWCRSSRRAGRPDADNAEQHARRMRPVRCSFGRKPAVCNEEAPGAGF
jgi:hypothetical protein